PSTPARERGFRVTPSDSRFDVSFGEGVARQRDERTDTHTIPAWGRLPTKRTLRAGWQPAPRSESRAIRFFPGNEFPSRRTGQPLGPRRAANRHNRPTFPHRATPGRGLLLLGIVRRSIALPTVPGCPAFLTLFRP